MKEISPAPEVSKEDRRKKFLQENPRFMALVVKLSNKN